ncbi:ABC transporter ATP-binding protein [Agrococcus jejuensis]|uniref:ABC-2 type transport system ATP-binding protein n=1 Tax=Agrococcus jejuensis TaxID=399736 RepID=A0A1G8E2T9_9MICO|nr:ABC transporter ATP-binding protein [Agrococcus jejuensis]SDH64266.1 ABC-2 type transport system ATP-binding protein [Agrococcus jejuensis]
MSVIATKALEKRFGRSVALDGVDLTVEQGEIHGFLGPNGAGKSTTIRILLGLLRASGGEASVLGMHPWRDATRIHERLASVPGDVTLWPSLTGGEAIDVLTRMRGQRPPARDRARLLDAFDLDPTKKGTAYSKGNRQKVALVAAFATPADLYVLDEPTSGLDPLMEEVFRAEVRRVADEGATVLLSSHILSEVEQLCSRVSIIRAGRIVEAGSLADLRHLSHTQVSWEGSDADADAPGLADVATRGGRVVGSLAPEAVPAFLAWAAQRTLPGLTMQPPSLEQLFLRHYGPVAESGGSSSSDSPSAGPLPEPLLEVRAERASKGAPAEPSDADHPHGRHARIDAPEP